MNKCGTMTVKVISDTYHFDEYIDVPIDKCIAELVELLNKHGIRTIGHSCCGHGEKEGSIAIDIHSINIQEGIVYLILKKHKREKN